MTLQDFCTRNGAQTRPYGKSDSVLHMFTSELSRDAMWDLFHLSDYVVSSSLSGPAVALVPKGGE